MERLRNQIRNLLKSFQLKNSSSEVLAFEKVINDLIQVKIDTIAPVPFSFSALVQFDQSGVILGVSDVLDAEYTFPVSAFGDESSQVAGFAFYLDTQRCGYWGDIVISVVASEIYDVDNKLPTIDQSNCNGLVLVEFNDTVEADETYTVAVTATGGGHSITRTFTLNVIADPE